MMMKNLRWSGPLLFLGLLAQGAFAAEPVKSQPPASVDAVPEGLTASDWTNIRAAYQAHRLQMVPVAGGYRARNPKQQWRTEFDGRGFITQPDAGGWQWGLELKSYGFPGKKLECRAGSPVKAEGDRLTYQRDAALREWFVNDRTGLEHGFTLEQEPGRANNQKASLEFDLAVRGNLRPEISPDGVTLRFVDAQGVTALTYSKLRVWDAEGKNLRSYFVAQPDGVRLSVEADGANYPITVDPLAQQAYLKASNTDAEDQFGSSVAVSGDTVIVGAYLEDSNAAGIDGDQGNNSAPDAGAAYVFVRNGGTWTQQAYLKASNTDAGDKFGYSVAVSGDTALVAAYAEDSSAAGINGDQTDNNASNAGAAYVFVRNGADWTQQAYLKASNPGAEDRFGLSVAASGDTVVVGAYFEDSSSSGINGDQDNDGAPDAGAAYVFVRDGAIWTQQAYLKASNAGHYDNFGNSVAISDDTVVVGAFQEDSSAVRVNGDQMNNSAPDAGAAYIFVRNGATWTQQAYLKASNAEGGDEYFSADLFGWAVAVSGDTVVVGALLEESAATGVNGDQSDNSAPASGAAYVFVRNGSAWTQQAYLKASNTDPNDHFGQAVAVSGDIVVVGADFESSSATGINGDQTDNSTAGAGAAYVFARNGLTWTQQAYLKGSNTEGGAYIFGVGDVFGTSVAVSGDTVVVGANLEDSSASGINGDESDNRATDAGAAYVFTLPTDLGNISARLRVETGDNVLIAGFIITGSQTKRVLVRAIGPSLSLTGALADPSLELRDGTGTLIASNDNWMDSSNQQEIIDTTIPPPNDLESAILATLDPGPYTTVMRGVDDTTGIGLVEAYDLDGAAVSELANISARGLVQTDDDVMIAGFILRGPSAREVLVRAIGPSLPGSGNLADPTLELFDQNGMLLASNDNWRDTQEADLIATTIPPTDDAESAILQTLAPAAYTAIVRSQNQTIGIALVEVYNLD